MPSVKIPCYIPSYMRVGKVTTLEHLPTMLSPIIAVHKSELIAYKKEYRGRAEVIGMPVKGIGKAREWMCAHAIKRGYNVIGMLDDDITSWIYCEDPEKFGGVRKATTKEVQARWRSRIRFAAKLQKEKKGFATSFTWRQALAFPHTPVSYGVRLGLVNECMLMNKEAMRKAKFVLEVCDDVHCTIQWLLDGVIAGQDPYLGHVAAPACTSAEEGGTGEYRANNANFYYEDHVLLWKKFPQVCSEPKDIGKARPRTRVGYKKAAQLGGVIYS